MEVRTQLEQLGPPLRSVVGGIRPDQLEQATPCSEFTVRGVLEHMVTGATVFAAGFRGEAPPAEVDTSDPVAQLGPALGELVDAILAPGGLEGTIAAPFGTVPREVFARFVVLDGLVHGWDLARATGQRYEPPADLVQAVEAFARQTISDEMRVPGVFAAATPPPDGASPIERLAAFTGRQI